MPNETNRTSKCGLKKKKKSFSSLNIIKYIFQFIYKLMLHLHWTDSALSALVSEGWAASEPWICLCAGQCSGKRWLLPSPPRPLRMQERRNAFIIQFLQECILTQTICLLRTWCKPLGETFASLYSNSTKGLKVGGKSLLENVLCFLFTCLWLSLELAGNLGKEGEVETSSSLPVTNASFAVARLTALNPVGSIVTVCEGRDFNL